MLKIATAARTRTDGRLTCRGTGDWKFGILKLEFYRETRDQLRNRNQPVLSLPQTVYNVTIRLSVPYIERSTARSIDDVRRIVRIKWTCQCLGSLSIGQVWHFPGIK